MQNYWSLLCVFSQHGTKHTEQLLRLATIYKNWYSMTLLLFFCVMLNVARLFESLEFSAIVTCSPVHSKNVNFYRNSNSWTGLATLYMRLNLHCFSRHMAVSDRCIEMRVYKPSSSFPLGSGVSRMSRFLHCILDWNLLVLVMQVWIRCKIPKFLLTS